MITPVGKAKVTSPATKTKGNQSLVAGIVYTALTSPLSAVKVNFPDS